MNPERGQILKVHPPKWTYTIRVHFVQNDDGTTNVVLTYADGTPLPYEEARKFLVEKGWLKE